MQSSEHLSKLAPALAAAQAQFRAVPKSGDNKFDKYTYANLEDYVASIRPILAAHKLSLLASVDDVTALEDRTTKNGGTEHAVRVKIAMRLVHESGEWIETHAWGEGQDRADKSVYKAITGGRKYGVASMLGLATSDDPEGDETTGQTAAPRQQAKPPTKPAAPAKVSPERSAALIALIKEKQVPEAKVTEWLNKAKAESFDDCKADTVEALIKVVSKMAPPQANDSDADGVAFVEQCNAAAMAAGLSPAELKEGVTGYMEGNKLTGDWWLMSAEHKASVLKLIKGKKGYFYFKNETVAA